MKTSASVNDMSAKSAEVVIVEFFNVQSIHFLTVRKHLLPLGKLEDVSSWLADEGFSEEGPMFAGLKCKRYSVFGAEIFHDLRDFVCMFCWRFHIFLGLENFSLI